MNGYLVDTNVLSELRKGARADPGVRAFFDEHAGSDIWVSVLVIGELRRGIARIERRDPVAAAALMQWYVTLVDTYDDRILPIDLPVANTWASFGVPDPVPVIDGLLAATAVHHDLILVTRNVSDVAPTGVRWLDPFEGNAG